MKIGNLEVYGVIYKIQNKVNKKIYIGQTTMGFDKRYNNNLLKNSSNKYLKSEIRKYGIENFSVCKIFDIAFSKTELDIKEIAYIKCFNSTNELFGYNFMSGGSHGKHREKTKKIISKLYKGKGNPMYGKNPLAGKTKEEIEIISMKKRISQKGKYTNLHRKHVKESCGKKVICISTNKVFDTISEASQKYNVKRPNIIKCCKNERNFCGKLEDGTKLKWMYYEEYLKNNTVV